jgi:hypothetical protein
MGDFAGEPYMNKWVEDYGCHTKASKAVEGYRVVAPVPFLRSTLHGDVN